jgi:polar amino acid transport system permease protein
MLPLDGFIFILKGVYITLFYTVFSLFCGAVIGFALAILYYYGFFKLFIRAYVSFIRGTPLLVQLSIIYFVLPQVIHLNISAEVAGIVTFSLNSAAYICEIVRAGLSSIDPGQFEAAKALHIPRFLTWREIILPQVIRNIYPALVNEVVTLLKESALISTIGVQDILRRAQLVAAEHYTYLQPFLIAAFTYYLIVLLVEYLSRKIWQVVEK